ncbi:hypothetical protein QZH41_020129 [Actinostola sp. cb2023]|nr:hypothetical protein QZH41_020129 [Actinostola sp. cb2023]
MSFTYPDLVIQNGRVIDPANNVDKITNVIIQDGKVVRVGDISANVKPKEVFDASGCLVTPGLIDLHAHLYEYATPLGVNPDNTCLARGVTTVVDAGSAGAHTFQGLRKYICERSKTRVLAFVHIASHGLSAAGCAGEGTKMVWPTCYKGGECDSLNQVDADLCAKCIKDNNDIAVGVKIRVTSFVTNDGKNEQEAFRRALAASSNAGVPLMIHYGHSTIPINVGEDYEDMSCPGSLCKGDIFTHAFHAHPRSIINPEKKTIHPSVHKARNGGVLFDVGHGYGSFSWTVAELCAKDHFWPDTISTDLHNENVPGPAYDLPMTMTKLLHIGMPLYDVIKAVTMAPALAIAWQDKIGSLSPNRMADVTILRVDDTSLDIEDCQGQLRTVHKCIVPVAVWKDGVRYEIRKPDPIPGHNTARLIKNLDKLIIKDVL